MPKPMPATKKKLALAEPPAASLERDQRLPIHRLMLRPRTAFGNRYNSRMVYLSKIYTKTGDKGHTALVGGQMVPKDSARIEAYGTVDELNAVIGLVLRANEEEAGPDEASQGEVEVRAYAGAERAVQPRDRSWRRCPRTWAKAAAHRGAARRGAGERDRRPQRKSPAAAQLRAAGGRLGVVLSAPRAYGVPARRAAPWWRWRGVDPIA